jgi:hypothetical protein
MLAWFYSIQVPFLCDSFLATIAICAAQCSGLLRVWAFDVNGKLFERSLKSEGLLGSVAFPQGIDMLKAAQTCMVTLPQLCCIPCSSC